MPVYRVSRGRRARLVERALLAKWARMGPRAPRETAGDEALRATGGRWAPLVSRARLGRRASEASRGHLDWRGLGATR